MNSAARFINVTLNSFQPFSMPSLHPCSNWTRIYLAFTQLSQWHRVGFWVKIGVIQLHLQTGYMVRPSSTAHISPLLDQSFCSGHAPCWSVLKSCLISLSPVSPLDFASSLYPGRSDILVELAHERQLAYKVLISLLLPQKRFPAIGS